MRETVRDWKNDWTAGHAPTGGIEVVIQEESEYFRSYFGEAPYPRYLYAGTFADIPENLLSRRVVKSRENTFWTAAAAGCAGADLLVVREEERT